MSLIEQAINKSLNYINLDNNDYCATRILVGYLLIRNMTYKIVHEAYPVWQVVTDVCENVTMFLKSINFWVIRQNVFDIFTTFHHRWHLKAVPSSLHGSILYLEIVSASAKLYI